jgi:hypothetical protein
MSDHEPTVDELHSASRELLKLWHARTQISPHRNGPGNADAKLHAVNGMSSHAFRLAETAIHLVRIDLALESAPVVRLALECALTAMWTALVPDGVEAMLNEDFRSRRNIATTLRDTPAWVQAGLDVPHPSDEDYDTSSTAQARRFNQLCDDLIPGGSELYSYYRLLSWFSHPTNYIIDRYGSLDESDDGLRLQLRLRRTPTPNGEEPQLYAHFSAMAMVIAAAAVDALDVDHSDRSAIKELADRVGCASEFRLAPSAVQRFKVMRRDA